MVPIGPTARAAHEYKEFKEYEECWGLWNTGELRTLLAVQDLAGVAIQEPAGFVREAQQRLCICIAQIVGQDQEIATFLEGALRDVEESCLIGLSSAFEALGYVGWHRYRGTLHLARQTVDFLLRKLRCQFVNRERKCVRLPPYQQVLKSLRAFQTTVCPMSQFSLMCGRASNIQYSLSSFLSSLYSRFS